ncbi:hypothetical protein D3C71_1886420 [compost metagenome]
MGAVEDVHCAEQQANTQAAVEGRRRARIVLYADLHGIKYGKRVAVPCGAGRAAQIDTNRETIER